MINLPDEEKIHLHNWKVRVHSILRENFPPNTLLNTSEISENMKLTCVAHNLCSFEAIKANWDRTSLFDRDNSKGANQKHKDREGEKKNSLRA